MQSIWSWLDVGAWQCLAAIGAALLGGTISGLTGFGFGLVVVPILLMLFPPATVVVLSRDSEWPLACRSCWPTGDWPAPG